MRNAIRLSSAGAINLIALTAIILLWFSIALGDYPYLDFVIIGFSIAFIASMDFRNPAHVMFMIGFLTFVVMPVVSIHDLIFINSSFILALCFSTLLFLWLTRNSTLPAVRTDARGHAKLKLLAVAGFCVVLSGTMGVGGLMTTPLVLVSFYYLVQGERLSSGLVMFCIVLGYIFIYALFFWGGYGRLILASWLMAAFWIVWYRYSLPFGKAMIFAPILGGEYVLRALGSTRRAFDMRENFLINNIGSDLGPFLLANNFSNSVRTIDVLGLIDQYTLYFLQWVPRTLWADKPLGFGYEYTVQNLGPGAIRSLHSIASLHVGEHLYYLNSFGYATSFITIFLVAASYRFLLRQHHRAPFLSLVFAMYLPTFVWGGMSSFASRFWTAFVFLLFLYSVIGLIRIFSRPYWWRLEIFGFSRDSFKW